MKYFIYSLKSELRLAKSALLKKLTFSVTVIGTLAITLGALICIFSLNHILMVKALPYPDGDDIVVINQSFTENGNTRTGQVAPAMIHTYKQQSVFSSMALMRDSQLLIANIPEQPNVRVNFVTPEYFSLLSPTMKLGRTITENEGLGYQKPLAVLSYNTWLKWFKGNIDIIGSKTQIGNISYEIIGVTAKDFYAPANRNNEVIDIWLPFDFNPRGLTNWNDRTRALTGIALLEKGVSQKQASASLTTLISNKYKNLEQYDASINYGIVLTSLKHKILGDSRQTALLLLSGVIVLLLIATSNVTNLFLSRAAEKQRTLAIQAAVGAKPGHLFTAMFAESLILCMVAGVLGLIVSGWGFVLLAELASTQLPRIAELKVDSIALLFTLVIVITLAIIFAKLSSNVVKYDDLKGKLQSSGKGSSLQISKKIRNGLIITQVTLASLLLAGTSVVIEKALSTIFHPLGFNDKNVSYLVVAKSIHKNSVERTSAELNLLTLAIKKALSHLPEVEQVSRSAESIIGFSGFGMPLEDVSGKRLGTYMANMVDHNYFNLVELPLVEGNTFSKSKDTTETMAEIIVSESLAKHLFPGKNVLGKMLQIQSHQPLKVVGIVKDYHSPGSESEQSYQRFYLPYETFRHLGFNIKFKPGSSLNKNTLLSALHKLDAKLRIQALTSHSEMHAALVYKHKLAAGITMVLALLALLLAAAGIYGVLNYSTQMRKYELGVHLAMGAKTHRIKNMVLKESIQPILFGIVVSTVITVLIYLVVRQQLTTDIEFNVFALLSTIPIMLFVSLIACYLPVHKVVNEDPVKALRNE